jgi:hypothetical protein
MSSIGGFDLAAGYTNVYVISIEGEKERFLRYASDPILRMGPHFLATLGMTKGESMSFRPKGEI